MNQKIKRHCDCKLVRVSARYAEGRAAKTIREKGGVWEVIHIGGKYTVCLGQCAAITAVKNAGKDYGSVWTPEKREVELEYILEL